MVTRARLGHESKEHTLQKTRVFVKQDGIHDTARWRGRSNEANNISELQTGIDMKCGGGLGETTSEWNKEMEQTQGLHNL